MKIRRVWQHREYLDATSNWNQTIIEKKGDSMLN